MFPEEKMGKESKEKLMHDIEIQSQEPLDKRSWCQRTFGKMDQGSMRGSIFSLLSIIIGIGCLYLPYSLKQSGLILGLGILFMNAVVSYIGLYNIALVCHKFKIYHYPDLIAKLLGKTAGFIVDIIFIFYFYTTMIANQVSFGKFVPGLCTSMNIHYDELTERAVANTAALVLIIIPLALVRKLTEIRYVAIFSCFSILFVVCVVLSEFPIYVPENNYGDIDYAKMDMNIFVTFSVTLYSYACHTNGPQVQGELFNSSVKRMNKVSFRAIGGIFLGYALLAIFGYLSLLGDTPTLIPNREPAEAISNDWAMIIAKILLGLTAIISLPFQFPVLRTTICKAILRIEGEPSLFT